MKKKQDQEKKQKIQNQRDEKLTKVWETEVLNDWDKMKSTAKVREIWTEGIPAKIR